MPSALTVFVDTNVLLYAQDPRTPAKQSRAETWLSLCWNLSCGRISSQVLNELYVNLRRVAPSMTPVATRTLVRRYRTWHPWQVDETTVDQAWDVQDRFGYGYWDCLMVAAAQMQGCELLLTEDLQHNQQIDKLRIVNPFLLSPDSLGASA
jgi:predicted nucleic acid-binding protein